MMDRIVIDLFMTVNVKILLVVGLSTFLLFPSTCGQVKIDVNNSVNSTIATFPCSTSQNASVNVTGIAQSFFEVNQKAGSVSVVLSRPIHVQKDIETVQYGCRRKVKSSIHLTPVCGGLPLNKTYTVYLKGIPDKYNPSFCYKNCTKLSSLQLNVPENTPKNHPIFEYRICDEDVVVGDIETDHPEVVPNPYISIESGSKKVIKLKMVLDYDQHAAIPMTTVLIESTTSNRTGRMNVSIVVEDVDDLGIQFNQTMYRCNCSENELGVLSNCPIEAHDMDTGVNADINYIIMPGDKQFPADAFAIDSNGSIEVVKPLDREAISLYVLRIKGYQVDRSQDRINYTTVVITVTDVDDNPPVMLRLHDNASIKENSPRGSIVYKVSATDTKDQGENAKFLFEARNTASNGLFKIDNITGIITVKNASALDREINPGPITMQVIAVSIRNTSQSSRVANITITILDENDNAPLFQGTPLHVTINKTCPLDTAILQVHAEDKDIGNNGKVLYEFTDGIDSPFSINNTTGIITVKSGMNETFLPEYNLFVTATDQADMRNERRSSSTVIKITVNDVNIHTPTFFPNITKRINVSEAALENTTLLELQAFDQDPTDKLTFRLEEDYNMFKITGNILKTSNMLDRETQATYRLTIAVNDSIWESNITLSVDVQDINDNAPRFNPTSYNFTINEEETRSNFNAVSATDKDEGLNKEITYTVDRNSKWSNNFTVNETNGWLSTIGRIDREAILPDEKVSFLIFAHDKGRPNRVSTVSVTVDVVDINDNAPIFQEKIVNFTFEEHTKPHMFYTAKARDADPTSFGNVKYHLQPSNFSSLIKVNEDGNVSFSKQLEFPDNTSTTLTFIITAYNSEPYITGIKNATQSIIIHIQDVNDYPPVFELDGDLLNIPMNENDFRWPPSSSFLHDSNFKVIQLRASDHDMEGIYKNILYRFDDPTEKFSYNSTTGKIRQLFSIDYENPKERQFLLKLTAFNKMPLSNGSVAETVFTINITTIDVNDNTPTFSADTECFVWENYTGTLNCSVSASDRDSDKDSYNKFNYSIQQPFNATFDISKNGVLSLRQKLDYEHTAGPLIIHITAEPVTRTIKCPGGDCNGYCTVTVHVLNINDEQPHFLLNSYNFSIAETNRTSLIVGKLSATDKDGDFLIFSVKDTTTYFEINTTGSIALIGTIKSLDYELQQEYHLTVIVNDSRYTDEATVSIHILPVNEFPPTFTDTYTWSIMENETVLEQINATDLDKGEGRITLDADIPSKLKKNISLAIDGKITVSTIDREALGNSGMIQFTVEAIDGGHPSRTGVAIVTIHVTGVNDNPPVYAEEVKHVTLYVKEGQQYAALFTSRATDADIGDGSEIYYSLIKGNATFNINETTGVLSSSSNLLITSSNNALLNIEVKAYNGDGQMHDIQHITIVLQDINNNKPKFNLDVYDTDLDECMDQGEAILRVTATDADTTTQYNTVSYWMEEYNDTFHVDTDTGRIYLTGSIDYDPPADQTNFTFKVYATDDFRTRNHFTYTTVNLTITNCNDNAPVFTTGIYWCNVTENSIGDFNCSAEAHDADRNDIKYDIVDGNYNQTFRILPRNGIISVTKAIDFDTMKSKVLRLKISASDGKHTSYAIVDVNVLDANDIRPEFKAISYVFKVAENMTNVPYFVGYVKVSDVDSEFSLSIGKCVPPCIDCFNISENGDIMGLTKLDYERWHSVYCEIIANDTLTMSESVKQNVTINIVDVNDNIPIFDRTAIFMTVNETAANGTFVIQVSATDADSSHNYTTVDYSIFGGNALDLFGIDSLTGTVTSRNNLENYSGNNVTLIIKASDNGKPPLMSYCRLTIYIKKLNIHGPVFKGLPYTATFKEDTSDVHVLQVEASDDDSNDLRFIVVNEPDNFYFQDRTLYAKSPDAEHLCNTTDVCYVLITINVTDGIHSATATVNATVIDVNDNTPYFVNDNMAVYELIVNDNTTVGNVVLAVTAQDDDISNDGFTFILYGGKGDFQINSTSGDIQLIHSLGRNGKVYDMSIIVSDHGDPPRFNSSKLAVTVANTNQQFDLNCSLEFNFMESNGKEHASLAATYEYMQDVRDISYEIISENKLGILEIFHLNSITGLLTLAKPLDYEHHSKYEFIVLAKDHGVFPKNATTNVTINVIDVNEAPTIVKYDKQVFKDVNTSANAFITRIEARDPDTSEPFSKLSYSLSDMTNFTVDENGTMTAHTALLTPGTYPIHITVTDGGNLSTNAEVEVLIAHVTFIDLFHSIVENNSIPLIIIEDLQAAVNNGKVDFEILPSLHSDQYRIVQNGSLVLREVIDRETTTFIQLHIQGREALHGSLIAVIKVNLSINDTNDCRPQFLATSYTVTIDDNTENDTPIATIHAIDKDVEEENRNLTYTLLGMNTDLFSVNTMGTLKVCNSTALNAQTYIMNISVTDGRFNDSALLTIMVVDTNNHSPAFDNGTYRFSIEETNHTNIDVGMLIAHDEDDGQNGNIAYSITAGNKDSLFQITNMVNDTCVITTAAAVDREKLDIYTLIITARDKGNYPRQGTSTVIIDILDVNDNNPKFQGASSYAGMVLENSENDTEVTMIQAIIATDADQGSNGTSGLVYKLNDTNCPICINDTHAKVYVCGEIDREKQDVYYLEVIAFDSHKLNDYRNASIPLTIRILDANDETPQFTESTYSFTVPENENTSVGVGNVSVTDKDLNGTQAIRYRIISGADGRFYIDTITGIIHVGGNVDREADSRFWLNVSAYDGCNVNYTQVEINVTDVNDNPPHFDFATFQAEVIVNVTEQQQAGIIFYANASDSDEQYSKNSEISYSVSSPDNVGINSQLFIMTEHGGLNLTQPLDREKVDHFKVNITATDNGVPPLSASILLHIDVLDINDNAPVFCVDGHCNITETECSTIEKAPVKSLLKLLGSNDPDAGKNGTVFYSIEESDVSKYFKIGNDTGIVTIEKPLVINTLVHAGMGKSNNSAELNVTVLATDGGGLQTSLILYVFVEPLNDDDIPVFDRTVFRFTINENEAKGSFVGSCIARVNDRNSILAYSLVSYGTFYIEPSSGNITTLELLDRELTSRYTLAVQVRDGRIPERTAFAAVEIIIEDVNDNSPIFSNSNITFYLPENSTRSDQINVMAEDIDYAENSEITYSLDDDYGGLFNINTTTGLLTLNGTFDYEHQHIYGIVVTAKDNGSPSRNNTANVTINVTDVNDNAPEFVNFKQSFNLSEATQASELFSVSATDKDSGWNGRVVYTIVDFENGPFGIDTFNGSVYLQRALDYEKTNRYRVQIVAQDQGTPSLSSSEITTIYVQDLYDVDLRFEQDIFNIKLPPSTPLNTSILNMTVGVKEVQFTTKGEDAMYFTIGTHSGELVLAKALSSTRKMYVVIVVANDQLNQTASCTVIIDVIGHGIVFQKTEFQVELSENLNKTSILLDLNTTEELTGDARYAIIDVKPIGDALFSVNQTSGVVSCHRKLDREEHAQYTILISAYNPETRRKREIPGPSSTVRLIVNVGDVNDNPPYFTQDQQHIFGVPDNVRANYVVTAIKAEDLDISDVGRLRYKIVKGRTDIFGIDQDTGEIITLVAIASEKKEHEFKLSVAASDGNTDNGSTKLDIVIYVVPTTNQPVLAINMSVAAFKRMQHTFMRNMSAILGVRIQFEKIEAAQTIHEDGTTNIDLSKTILHFHGINKTTGQLVSNNEMKELLASAMDALSRLFDTTPEVRDVLESTFVIADPSAISVTQILFICMAVLIFFGSLVALVVVHYSWTRYEIERQVVVEKEEDRVEQEMELSTIRSRQSSKLSSLMASSALSPAYTETEFITRNGRISPSMKETPQLDSQEVRIIFEEEPLAYLNRQNVETAEQSVIDSGVGNTSVLSDSDSKNRLHSVACDTGGGRSSMLLLPDGLSVDGEGPIMTSSPRVSRDLQHLVDDSTNKVKTDRIELADNATINVPDVGKEKQGYRLLHLDCTGESETDDELDHDDTTESNNGDLIVENRIPDKPIDEDLHGSNETPTITVEKDEDDSNENITAIEITSF